MLSLLEVLREVLCHLQALGIFNALVADNGMRLEMLRFQVQLREVPCQREYLHLLVVLLLALEDVCQLMRNVSSAGR